MKLKLAIALLLFCGVCQAADGVLVVTKAGYFFMAQNDQGVPSLTPLGDVVPPFTVKQSLKLDDFNPPTPDPTNGLAAHKRAVQAATVRVADPNKVNAMTALGKMYRTVAGLPVTNREQLVQATDLIFGSLSLPSVWATWKQEVDKSSAGFSALDDAKKSWQVTADVLEGK